MEETGEIRKEPHFIDSRVLKALGGHQKTKKVGDREISLVEGAYLWSVDDKEKGKGIFRHCLLVSRVAYYLGKELKEKKILGYEDVNLQYVTQGALLHDAGKLYAESREKLSPEIKAALGIPLDFKESVSGADETASGWLKELGFSPEVYEAAIKDHNFPQEVKDNPYWRIILVADYMAGQRVMSVEERLNDVKTRWIDQRITQGLEPRIDPEMFAIAANNIRRVAKEIFTALETTDKEFIEKHGLNSSESQTRWEKFLMKTRVEGREQRAKELVETFIG